MIQIRKYEFDTLNMCYFVAWGFHNYRDENSFKKN